MDNRQLYHVAPNVADSGDWYSEYYPGVSPSGDQMILVSLESMMYAYRFDHEGRYLERLERQRAGYTPPSELRRTIQEQQVEHRNRDAKRREEISAWARELGFSLATIKVWKFNSRVDGVDGGSRFGPAIAIYDYPQYFDSGYVGDDTEVETTLQRWHERGAFVLMWNDHEYTLDRHGRLFC